MSRDRDLFALLLGVPEEYGRIALVQHLGRWIPDNDEIEGHVGMDYGFDEGSDFFQGYVRGSCHGSREGCDGRHHICDISA